MQFPNQVVNKSQTTFFTLESRSPQKLAGYFNIVSVTERFNSSIISRPKFGVQEVKCSFKKVFLALLLLSWYTLSSNNHQNVTMVEHYTVQIYMSIFIVTFSSLSRGSDLPKMTQIELWTCYLSVPVLILSH